MAIAKRKKKFFDVEIPLISKDTQLQAYDVEELNGRFIKYDLTRILRGKSIILSLKVKIDSESKKATSIPREIKVLPSFLRRMVRKGTNYIEDSFSANCKDAQIRIKPFLITRRKVSRAVRKALRDKAREELIKYIQDKKSEEIFRDTFSNQLQKPLSLKLKKIYPLSLCEIRVLKVEKELSEEDIKEEKEKLIEMEKEEKENKKEIEEKKKPSEKENKDSKENPDKKEIKKDK